MIEYKRFRQYKEKLCGSCAVLSFLSSFGDVRHAPMEVQQRSLGDINELSIFVDEYYFKSELVNAAFPMDYIEKKEPCVLFYREPNLSTYHALAIKGFDEKHICTVGSSDVNITKIEISFIMESPDIYVLMKSRQQPNKMWGYLVVAVLFIGMSALITG